MIMHRENLVAEGKLPEGGLEQMQQEMLRELERMVSLTDEELWTEVGYYSAAGVVLGVMYLFSPQGRIIGIETMHLIQTVEIFEKGFTDTGIFKNILALNSSRLLTKILYNNIENFKTVLVYLKQPILFGNVGRTALTFFLNRVRVYAEHKFPSLTNPESPLLPSIRVEGRPLNCGPCLKNTAERVHHLHMGCNAYRAQFSTYMMEQYIAKQITERQAQAVRDVSCNILL